MPKIRDFYRTRPDELEPGDVLVVTVTLHIQHHGPPYYSVYRCGYPPNVHDGIPQGSRLSTEQAGAVAEALFPVVAFGTEMKPY